MRFQHCVRRSRSDEERLAGRGAFGNGLSLELDTVGELSPDEFSPLEPPPSRSSASDHFSTATCAVQLCAQEVIPAPNTGTPKPAVVVRQYTDDEYF